MCKIRNVLLLFIILLFSYLYFSPYYKYKLDQAVLKEYITGDFTSNAERLLRKYKGRDNLDDFTQAVIVKAYIESIGDDDPRYIIDKKVCNIIQDENFTNILDKYYLEYIKRTESNESITYKKSFYEGLTKAKKKCGNLSL